MQRWAGCAITSRPHTSSTGIRSRRRDESGGTLDVARDGEVLARGQQAGDALGWVVWDVNRAAADAGADHLLFHSGAVEADGAGVLFPGASGSGKSTLTAGLVRSRARVSHRRAGGPAHGERKAGALPQADHREARELRRARRHRPRRPPGAGIASLGGPGVAGGGRGGHRTCDRDTLRPRLRDCAPPRSRRQNDVDPALGHPGLLRAGGERGEPRRARIRRNPCPRPPGAGVPVLLADLLGPR